MAPLFRPRRRSPEADEERGGGGKIVRGRRRAAAAPSTPYQRPQSPPALPSPGGERNPSWLSGLISGAGKLISAVLWSQSSSSDYSSDEEDEEDIISNSNEDEGTDDSSEDLPEINQGGKQLQLVKSRVQTSSAIVPKSESKIAIEQLLMQETFSRDECTKLTEMLKSRVVDYSSGGAGGNEEQEGIQQNTTYSSIPYPSNNLSAIAPGYSSLQARTPDLRATAVMEAKKWLDEKKSASSSNTYLNYGPCTLNTDTLHYGVEDEAGSPVDMAKSYMRSLPPWQSMSLHRSGFKTPPPSRKDEMTCQTTSYSLPSSKVLKRNHHEIETLDTNGEIRRVRVKSIDDRLDSFNDKQDDPSISLLENKSPFTSSAAEIIEKHAEDPCTNGALSSRDDEATGGNNPTNTGSDPSRWSCLIPLAAEQVSSFSIPSDSLVLASSPVKHDGDHLSGAKIISTEEIESITLSDADDVINHHMHSSIKQIDSGEDGKPEEDKLKGDLGGPQIYGAKGQDGNTENQEDLEVLRGEITANGAQADTGTNSDLNSLSKGGASPISSNTSDPAIPIPGRTHEIAADIHVDSTNIHAGRSQSGRRIKSIERMLTETQAGPSRRGRKVAVRGKRGRGRVKSGR